MVPVAAAYPLTRRVAAPWWIWPNLLSLDAPVVAVLWCACCAHCLHVEMSAAVYTLLALAVWVIYVADRTLDVWRDASAARLSPRHAFYDRHWRTMLPLASFAVLLAAYLAWLHLASDLFRCGLAVSAGVLFYFGMVHSSSRLARFWPKELVVAVLFAAGTFGPVLTRAEGIRWDGRSAALIFAALCFANCAAIDAWESDGTNTKKLIALTGNKLLIYCSGVALLSIAAAPMTHSAVRLLFAASAASALLLVLLDLRRERFSPELLRVLADGALLTPLPFLLLVR